MNDLLKNVWFLPVVVVLGIILFAVNKFDFSLTDFVADRVIQRLNANYSPYGPSFQNPQGVLPGQANPQQPQQPSQPWPQQTQPPQQPNGPFDPGTRRVEIRP